MVITLLQHRRNVDCETIITILADRTNDCAYATVLRLFVVCRLLLRICLWLKRVRPRAKVRPTIGLLTAYRKSYVKSRLVPK